LGDVGALTRPPDDVFYKELVSRYRSVRRFLPTVLTQVPAPGYRGRNAHC
jgi:hypothetical protein